MENEVIVELLGEGGSRALYGVRQADDWLFSLDFIRDTNPPSTGSGAAVVNSWEEAIALLDKKHGWYRLAPTRVHPEFATALYEEVRGRKTEFSRKKNLERWRRACSLDGVPKELTTTSEPIHSSDQWLYAEVEDLEPTESEIEQLRKMLRDQGADESIIDRMAPRRKPSAEP